MAHEGITVPVLSDALAFAPLTPARRAGDFVYVSGMPPFSIETGELVHGDVETQTRASLAAVETCLRAAGATLDEVVNVRIYCANAAWFGVINRVYAEFFTAPYPTRTFVPVASWPAEFDVEVDCVAYSPTTADPEVDRTPSGHRATTP